MKVNNNDLRIWALLGILFLNLPLVSFSQGSLNMSLLGRFDNNNLPANSGVTYNDVWGYAAGGREYGLFGTIQGVYVYDVTVPSALAEVDFIQGAWNDCIWRDIKTYGNHAYLVGDAGPSSLQILDLSSLPASVSKVYDSNALFTRAHNVFINQSNGRMYVAGSDVQNNGLLVLDVSTNPANPTLLGSYNLGNYVHDVYVSGDTVYCFMGNAGMTVWDFRNLSNVNQLGSLPTYPEQGYCHQGYGTKNGDYLFMDDETHDVGIKVVETTNMNNLQVRSVFRSTLLGPTWTNSIAHNVYIKENYAFISYYHDGIQVYDITNPETPINVAYYDTDSTPFYFGFEGVWGVYPYLPSGNILATDVKHGFQIFSMANLFPVEFGEFTAEQESRTIRLNWSTLSEQNNQFFGIERSENGEDFQEIARIEGIGTTNRENHYESLDADPHPGMNYYRLRQVDLDGQVTYSKIVAVRLGEDFDLLQVYPNPIQHGEQLSLSLSAYQDETIRVAIFNLLGQEVASQSQNIGTGQHNLHLPTNELAPGAYWVKVSTSRTTRGHKILVQ